MASQTNGASPVPTDEVAQGPVLISISVTVTLFAMVMCAARTAIRLRITKTFGYDDYAIYVAMVMGFVGMIFTVVEGSSLTDRIRALEFDFLAQPWLMFGSTMAKVSICFFFLRTIGGRRPWNIVLGGLIVLLALVNLIYAIVINMQCQPLEKLWNPSVDGTCFDPSVELGISYVQGGFAVFTYFFLAAAPVMIVRDAHLIRSIRWPFYSLTALSLISGILAIIRIYESSTPAIVTGYTSNTLVATLLAVLEQGIAIVAANLLALGPLFSDRGRLSEDEEMVVRGQDDGSVISLKDSTTTLIIQGIRKAVDELGGSISNLTGAEGSRGASRGSEQTLEDADDSTAYTAGVSTPPNGILKTVSVEVVEEEAVETETRSVNSNERRDGNEWRVILRG